MHLFSQGFEGTAFFTAQEEAGKSWRYLLEWFRRFGGSTNRLFVVDTSPFPDVDEANNQQIVLRQKDANAAFNVNATKAIADLCEQLNYSYTYKDKYVEKHNATLIKQGKEPHSIGSTELGRIIAASNGLVDGTTIQIPTTNYHTMKESASVESVQNFIHLLTTLANEQAL